MYVPTHLFPTYDLLGKAYLLLTRNQPNLTSNLGAHPKLVFDLIYSTQHLTVTKLT